MSIEKKNEKFDVHGNIILVVLHCHAMSAGGSICCDTTGRLARACFTAESIRIQGQDGTTSLWLSQSVQASKQ